MYRSLKKSGLQRGLNPWPRNAIIIAHLIKNTNFARSTRALCFWTIHSRCDLTTTWNDQFCSCVDEANIWREIKQFFISKPLKLVEFQDYTYFASQTREMITYVPSYIFRYCLCLISIFWADAWSTAKFPHQSESAVQILLFISASVRPFAVPKRGNMFDHAVWFWMQVQDWFPRRTVWDDHQR